MGDRVAVFKATGLGDYIREPETITLDGEEPERASGLYANMGVLGDRGGGSVYRVELKAHVHRAGTESYLSYLKRRLGFLRDLRTARGFYPPVAPFNASTLGTLAVSEDSSLVRQSTALAAAGSNVTIPTSGIGPVTIANDERWYGFDTVSGVYTTFTTAPSSGSSVIADVLDIALPSGSFLFRATFVLRGAYLLPGITLQGEEPGSTSATKDIPLAFVSVDDPLYDGAP
jgi:hypothetical protein